MLLLKNMRRVVSVHFTTLVFSGWTLGWPLIFDTVFKEYSEIKY